ncbi:MAG: ABC transporter permease subunit [Planctomycetota bacterium]|jgi:ABC-type phosphate transport system permease subunit|nr:ABC transporter permease subunit [Planctomycetota bacterium]
MTGSSTDTPPQVDNPAPAGTGVPRRPRRRSRTSLIARGEPMVWLTGGGLAISVWMIVVLMVFVVVQGLTTFWPTPIVRTTMHDGRVLMGEITRRNDFKPEPEVIAAAEGVAASQLQAELEANDGAAHRRLMRTANFDVTRTHFTWVSDYEIASEDTPEWAVLLERLGGWGRFFGIPKAYMVDGEVAADGADAAWAAYLAEWPQSTERRLRVHHLKKRELGHLDHQLESARLAVASAKIRYGDESSQYARALADEAALTLELAEDKAVVDKEVASLEAENQRFELVMMTAAGEEQRIEVGDIVRAVATNRMSAGEKFGVYLDRWWEFLFDDPRDANAEGGVWPAIFGTIVMTLIMTIVVVPFGVLAALYLREYAKPGMLVSVIRIAINNLAGVPSIVFGVFGLGFFCYQIGSWVDGGPQEHMSIGPWIGMALATVMVTVVAVLAMLRRNALTATHGQSSAGFDVVSVLISVAAVALFAGLLIITIGPFWGVAMLVAVLFAMWRAHVQRQQRGVDARVPVWLDWAVPLAWVTMVGLLIIAVWSMPWFNGFYRAKLPTPTYGTGGIMWASLTLALLTLPVVIVATEEALSAVPRSMREGSYACGASKWQTIQRIVLPRALPGIMTGSILAMARGAGEVAPLMLVGAVKLAPELPMDVMGPWDGFLGFLPVHPERSFMHLGFHIFDLGFQSQNSEAAKPMVFTTTLLLITIVVTLNLSAIYLRSRLRRRFGGSQF